MIRTQPRPIKPRILRITKDVRELTLENLQLIHEVEPGVAWPDWTEGGGGEIKPKEESTSVGSHYLCISKHFCGPATDLALSWMREQRVLQEKRKKEEGGEPQDLYSICFATCCHGICEPSLVVAKAYLLELLNSSSSSCGSIKKRKRVESEELDVKMMDKTDSSTNETTTVEQPSSPALVSEEQLEAWIPWIIKLTGWATLGKEEESSLVARPGKDASLAEEEVMTRNQRRVLGKRCKKLLDMARCMYLMRECGFREAKSIEYTTESVESGAIVGTM
ncbi:MAG: methyltransferase TRM13-domain-containing protein [Linnemannia gamsii]|nr:MAG: methyltransferase TRM13-domain-containing protein [Linnemannia gamsii]